MNVNVTRDPRVAGDSADLNLTVEDLRRVADTLATLREARLRFKGELEVAGHLLAVRWESDQREGDWPVLVGIRRA